MNKQDLLDLKSQIEENKTKVAELNGKLKYLNSQLKDQFDCLTIEEAKKKQSKLEKKATEIKEQIEQGIREIEEKYEIV